MAQPGAFADLVPDDADAAAGALPIVRRLETGGLADPDNAVSKAGAVGRNQIMPATAKQYGLDPAKLTDGDYNDHAATTILADLADRYHGDVPAVLAGFNGGPGRGDAFVKAGHDASVLPGETQNYLKKSGVSNGGAFDDLVPGVPKQAAPVPAAPASGGAFADLVPPHPLELTDQDRAGAARMGQDIAALNPPHPSVIGSITSYIKHLFAGDEPLPQKGVPESTTAESALKLGQNIPAQLQHAAGGVVQRLGETPAEPAIMMGQTDPQAEAIQDGPLNQAITTSAERPGTVAALGKKIAASAQKHLTANAPNLPANSVKQYAYDIVSGVVQMAPLMAASAVTKSPGPMLSGFAIQGYGDKYAESRAAGRTPEQADADATFSAAAQTIPAELPLHALMKPGQKFLGKVLQTAGAGALQNEITTALQTGYDKGTIDQNMTWGEAREKLVHAGIVGVGFGAALGFGGGAAGRISKMREAPAGPEGMPPAPAPASAAATEAPATIEPQKGQIEPQTAAPAEPVQDASKVLAKPAPLETVHDPVTWAQTGWKLPDGTMVALDDPRAAQAQARPAEVAAEKPFTTTPGAISAEHAAEVSSLEAQGTKDADPQVKAAQQALATNIDPETGHRPKGNAALRVFRVKMQAVIDGNEKQDIVPNVTHETIANANGVPLQKVPRGSSKSGIAVVPEVPHDVSQGVAEVPPIYAGGKGQEQRQVLRKSIQTQGKVDSSTVPNVRDDGTNPNASRGLSKTTGGDLALQNLPPAETSSESKNAQANAKKTIQAYRDAGVQSVQKPKKGNAAVLPEVRDGIHAGIQPEEKGSQGSGGNIGDKGDNFQTGGRLRGVQRAIPKDSDHVAAIISRSGGIRNDEGHDLVKGRGLQQMIPGVGPMIRPTGKSVDAIGEILWNHGFFGPTDHTPRPTEDDVLQLLERTGRGADGKPAKVFAPERAAELEQTSAGAKAEEDNATASQDIAKEAKGFGFELTPEDVDTILENMGHHGIDAETAVAEHMERQALESHEVLRENAGHDIDDIPFDTEATAVRPAEDGRGAGAGSEAPEGTGAGAGEGAEGGPGAAEPAREAEQNLNTEKGADGLDQTIVPGGEQSARQLAQAREAGGKGRIKPKVQQKDAGGMFEEPTEPEPDMFAPKPRDKSEPNFALQQGDEKEKPFYSALTRGVEGLKQEKAPADQWMATLKNLKNVKQEELDWSGVEPWLADRRGQVSKADLLQHLRENEVGIKEVQKGEPALAPEAAKETEALNQELRNFATKNDIPFMRAHGMLSILREEGGYRNPEGREKMEWLRDFMKRETAVREKYDLGDTKPARTKYDTYRLPGGKNYRELLLTLPHEQNDAWHRLNKKIIEKIDALAEEGHNLADLPDSDPRAKEIREMIARGNAADSNPKDEFRSSHFDEPNILAHVRFDDRTGPDGEKVLHVAEIQSDWHQEGRKRGYQGDAIPEEDMAKAVKKEDGWYVQNPNGMADIFSGSDEGAEARANEQANKMNLDAQRDQDRHGIPSAPFKTSWHELALKRMVRFAAEHGYDRLSWDTGQTVAQRFGMEHHIKEMRFDRAGTSGFTNLSDIEAMHSGGEGSFHAIGTDGREAVHKYIRDPKELHDLIGKELAEKLMAQEPGREVESGTAISRRILRGLDLKIGGEGHKGFYDRILPQFANKYLKKFGSRVEDFRLQEENPALANDSVAHAVALGIEPVHSIAITDAMRESALQGQPFFAKKAKGWDGVDAGESPGQPTIEERAAARGRVRVKTGVTPEFAEAREKLVPILRRRLDQLGLKGTGLNVVDWIKAAGENQPPEFWSSADGVHYPLQHLIKIALESQRGAEKALDHESIHALRAQGLISDPDWAILEKRSAEKWVRQYKIEHTYAGQSREKILEEGVAHAFEDHVQGKKNQGNAISRVFNKIASYFKAIRDSFSDVGLRTAEDVFNDIDAGKSYRGPKPEAYEGPDFARQKKPKEEEEEPKAEGLVGRATQALDHVIGETSAKIGARINAATDRLVPEGVKDASKSLQMAFNPMSAGSPEARAAGKDFANAMRTSRNIAQRQFDYLGKTFKPDQLAKMWEAADEESVLRQQGVNDRKGKGLDRLQPDERAAIEAFQAESNAVLKEAKDIGMFDGEGLPSYMPRMVVAMGADGKASRLGYGGEGVNGLDSVGRNLKTTSANLKQRKYLTAKETEEAAQHLDPNAVIVKDVRTLPMTTARLREAIAGRRLINTIKEIGDATGEQTVSEPGVEPQDGHKWFTIDHPAFKKFAPKMIENPETGKMEPLQGQDGNLVFEKKPIFVRDDFEGPLRAVLSSDTNKVVKAFMNLKGKTMSVIMYSPLMHNAVIWGKAFPAAPLKLLNPIWRDPSGKMHLSIELYGQGRMAKNDPVTMKEAMSNGLDPIGHRFGFTDATGLAEAPNIKPGRSLTAKAFGYAFGLRDAKARDNIMRAIDKAGDVWHNKLLWDLVGDLQMGLYTHLRDHAVKAGNDPLTAGRYAAHFANRYAGALPIEAMSKGARLLANTMLFSRTFTLTNVAAYKDLITGLPGDVQAQITRDSGVKALNQIQGTARRKAAAMLAFDYALSHVGTYMAAYAIAWATNQAFQPPSENEPDKKNRFLIRYEKDGTAVYGRLPTGKVSEDQMDWVDSPVALLKKKLSPFAHAAYGLISNDQGFGRKIYDPYDDTTKGWFKNAARSAKFIAESVLPLDPFEAAAQLNNKKGDERTKVMQILLPMMGITVSKGAPGGPAMGQLYASKDEHEFQVGEAMPDIKDRIANGDIKGAVSEMTKLGMSRSYQKFIIKTAKTPGARLTKRQIKEFMGYASPDEKDKMKGFLDRARDDQHSALEPGDFRDAIKSGDLTKFAANTTWSRDDAIRAATAAGMPATAAFLRETDGMIRPKANKQASGEPAFG